MGMSGGVVVEVSTGMVDVMGLLTGVVVRREGAVATADLSGGHGLTVTVHVLQHRVTQSNNIAAGSSPQ